MKAQRENCGARVLVEYSALCQEVVAVPGDIPWSKLALPLPSAVSLTLVAGSSFILFKYSKMKYNKINQTILSKLDTINLQKEKSSREGPESELHYFAHSGSP